MRPGLVYSTSRRRLHPGQLRWVRDHEPKVLLRPGEAMLPGDYLAFRLTGDFSTTATGLSEMVAWDFDAIAPSDEAWVAAAKGDLRLRPTIVPMLGDQGSVSASANVETGLPVGTPIAYRCGDQPNNAFALGVVAPGTLRRRKLVPRACSTQSAIQPSVTIRTA